MKSVGGFLLAALFGVVALFASDDKPGEPVSIALFDQHDEKVELILPAARPTLVAIADRNGIAQLAGWIDPLHREFGDRIEFLPVADVSRVPGSLRKLVRRAFVKDADYSIALDWSGDTVAQFDPVPDEANISLLDPRGRIEISMHGAAVIAQLDELRERLRARLSKQPDPQPKPAHE